MSLFNELKRRNVFKVSVAYIAATWLLLQLADLLQDVLQLPHWAPKLVLLLLVIGFVPALIFAWAFELTPEGLKREIDVEPTESMAKQPDRRLDFIIIGLLAVSLAYFIWESRFSDRAVQPQLPVADQSIVPGQSIMLNEDVTLAVLPFVNMSSDTEQEYFSDGMTEEILNMLAGTKGMAVTSRTSAFAFKGKQVPITEIARELHVDHIVEGSVRKSGNKVRITVQLIQVEGDRHLWSQSFDRELTDIFAVQDEIARSIAKSLQVSLLDGPDASPRSQIDPDAYDLFLRGQGLLQDSSTASLDTAAELLQQSLEIEPDFVPALLSYGEVLRSQNVNGSATVSAEDNVERMRRIVAQGRRLESDHPGFLRLQGSIASYEGNDQAAFDLYRRAYELDPHDPTIVQAYAFMLRQTGNPDAAVRILEDLLQTDPLNLLIHLEIGSITLEAGDWQSSISVSHRIIDVMPDNSLGPFLKSLAMHRTGDIAGATQEFLYCIDLDPDDPEGDSIVSFNLISLGSFEYAFQLIETAKSDLPDAALTLSAEAFALAANGQLSEAESVAVRMLENPVRFGRWYSFVGTRLALRALIRDGQAKRGYELLLGADPILPAIVAQSASDAPELSAQSGLTGPERHYFEVFPDLVVVARAAGEEQAASNALSHLENNLEWRASHQHWQTDIHRAELAALQGDFEMALSRIEASEASGEIHYFWQHHLLFNMLFDPIRDDPRFVAVVERVRAEMNRQLENMPPLP